MELRGSGARARSPGPGVGGLGEVLVRAGTGGGGKCAASPWRVDRARRLNVEVGQELAYQIKIRASQEDRTISEITRELWIEYLNR